MGAEIDRLEIQVETQATRANAQLDRLIGKLNNVANALAGVNGSGFSVLAKGVRDFAQASGGLSNVKTADFTRLVKNVERLTAINAQQLYGASSALTAITGAMNGLGSVSDNGIRIADMAKNISKLGGVNVQKAITNLPQLETAMTSFMTSMSQAPMVSKNIIQMTSAMAELASQGNKVGTAAAAVSKGMSAQARNTERAEKHAKGLASALGSLYQKYFWIKRGVQAAWGTVESSMDFAETVNYFEVALRKIGNDASSQWRENGYSSAEAYAESFSVRLKQLTAKMTGFEVDGAGNAVYTGSKNLGLNPDEVLQWQAVYAQMTDSLGLAEESTLRFSKALTMLGADWASLRNLSFDTAWNKFASALAGQSRAVRSLGIDITQATLQEYAYKYGLEEAVSEMNQAQKAQLRLLAILDQSIVAYGDLANTIASPANQFRMWEQNIANLGRTIGNLFLPIVQRVLPWVNGLTIALQNLFSWAGGLMGIKLDSINSSMGGMPDEMADLVGGAEDYEDALDGANTAAKKLRNNLQSWHEINNINTPDTSAAGGSIVGGGSPVLDSAIIDALADYEKAWNEAFENMENEAQEWADRIGGYLEPLKDIIDDFVIGDFFQAGKDTSALAAGIFNFVADAIDNVDWYGIGQNIGDYLAGIDWTKVFLSLGNMLWQGIKGAIELTAGMFSTAPIETALISLFAMPKALKAITASKYITGIKNLFKNFKLANSALAGNKESLDVLTKNYPKLGKSVDIARKAFANFQSGMKNGNFFTGLDMGISTIRDNLTGLQKGFIGVASVAGEFILLEDAFYDLASGSDNVVESLFKIVGGAGAASAALYVAFGPAGLAMAAVTGVAAAIMGVNKAIEEAELETMFDSLKENGTVALEALQTSFEDAVTDISGYADETREKLSSIAESRTNIEETAGSIGLLVKAVENGAYGLEEKIPLIIEQFNGLLTETKSVFEEEYEVIVGNVVGAYADILEAQGLSVPSIVQGLADLRDKSIAAYTDLEEQARVLEEQYESGVISQKEFLDNYIPIMEKISAINGEGEIDKTAAALENLYGALDMSKYIDGTEFDVSGFTNDIEQFAITATNGKDAIAEFGENAKTTLDDMITHMKEIGTDTDKYSDEILSIYGANDEYVEKNTQAIEEAYQGYMNIIQRNLLEQLPSVVENATKDYDKLQWWEKLFKTKSEYVNGVVRDWKENIISPATGTIQEGLNELGIEGSTWAEAEAVKIVSALFTDFTYETKTLGLKYVPGLRSDWNSFIENSLSEVPGISETYGGSAVTGFNAGISANIATTEEAVGNWMSDTETAIHDSAMDFGSPSKTAIEFGRNTVLGYNLGISENTNLTITTIEEYIDKAITAFSGIIEQMTSIGSQAMQGFNVGMGGMSGEIVKKAQDIADSVSDTFKKALDIHSPSRVMFSLGEYTTEGFINGIESMFPKVESTVGDFTRITQGLYNFDRNDYQPQVTSFTEQYYEMNTQYDYMTEETNNLLRQQNELLRALLEKPVLDSGDIFKASRVGYRSEAARLHAEGDPARIWG